jgi:hypothetical protein
MAPPIIVTDGMLIALANDIINSTAYLALIDKHSNPGHHKMAKKSFDVHCQQYSQWSVEFHAASPALQDTVTPWSRATGQSRSPPALPPHNHADSHSIVSMATQFDCTGDSDHHAQQYLARSS